MFSPSDNQQKYLIFSFVEIAFLNYAQILTSMNTTFDGSTHFGGKHTFAVINMFVAASNI